MTQFDNIEYLKTGTDRQQRAYAVLTEHAVLDKLEMYSPILAGTIPLDVDIEESDLDIICCWPEADVFSKYLIQYFSHHRSFSIRETVISLQRTIVATFCIDEFTIEIFGQNRPTKQQEAYQHMIVENRLLLQKGESFRKKIRKLKKNGLKTEPAFAKALGIDGDPYKELLDLYNEA